MAQEENQNPQLDPLLSTNLSLRAETNFKTFSSFDSSKFPNDQDIHLVNELEHKQVFKLKDTDKRVPRHILRHVDPYILHC